MGDSSAQLDETADIMPHSHQIIDNSEIVSKAVSKVSKVVSEVASDVSEVVESSDEQQDTVQEVQLEFDQINALILRKYDLMHQLEMEIIALKEQRKGLLPKLFSAKQTHRVKFHF